jgi:hypothetical protein
MRRFVRRYQHLLAWQYTGQEDEEWPEWARRARSYMGHPLINDWVVSEGGLVKYLGMATFATEYQEIIDA